MTDETKSIETAANEESTESQGKVQVSCTPGFLEWMRDEGISVAFTTYQTNRLFLVGRAPDGRLSAFERLLDRPMGLAASAERLWVATRFQLWRFDQVLPPGERHQGRDRLYVPRVGHVTGEVDAHDVHFTGDGRAADVVFVNTLYCCLARLSERHSFQPIWQPPWISQLMPEDRCHLNGLAMEDGRPRFVTSVSRTDERHGWRQHRADGGMVVEVESGEVVASGLSMPHSPRLHQGELYAFDSGNGELVHVDPADGRVEPVVFCPGYLRGLAFRGRHALVGLSKPRDKTFRGLPLDDRLADAQADPLCALRVIDLESGRAVHELQIHGVVTELYDVAILPDTVRPMALGFKSDEIRRVITFERDGDGEGGAVTRHNLTTLEAGKASMMGTALPERQIRAQAGGGTEGAATGPEAPAGASPDAAGSVGSVGSAGSVGSVGLVGSVGTAGQSTSAPPPGRVAARTLELTLAEALRHADLTFPDLRRTAASRPLREPLLATVLTAAGDGPPADSDAPLAVAVTNRRPGGETAEVISLVVRSDLRRRGLGSLLLAAVEAALSERGFRGVDLTFRDSWRGTPALRRLLAARGWTTPKTQLLLALADERFLEQPWVEELSGGELPEGYEIFPWDELSRDERRDLARRQQEEEFYPQVLSPFQMQDRVAPEVSVGLRHRGRVIGWLVTHRVSEEVVQYTSLFVEPGHGKLGRGLPLVAAAARRQKESGVPRAIFMVQADNRAMRRLLDRRLAPFLVERGEMLRSGKALATG